MKSQHIKIYFALLALVFTTACSTQKLSLNKRESGFAKGADISWLPQMEATGFKFYNKKGVEEGCFKF